MRALIKNTGTDALRWLRSVLRSDVVPLATVTARARMEGVDMQELWQAIREGSIQIDGAGSARYIKLPHTVWNLPKLAPEHESTTAQAYPSAQAAKAAMARLSLSGDDRIVCQACVHCDAPRCPGGQPIPDMVSNRCQHFTRTTQE